MRARSSVVPCFILLKLRVNGQKLGNTVACPGPSCTVRNKYLVNKVEVAGVIAAQLRRVGFLSNFLGRLTGLTFRLIHSIDFNWAYSPPVIEIVCRRFLLPQAKILPPDFIDFSVSSESLRESNEAPAASKFLLLSGLSYTEVVRERNCLAGLLLVVGLGILEAKLTEVDLTS